MFQSVELPVWALILIVGFAAVTFASHFLFPSVRWFFRKRAERAVARLNQRLKRPIEPFKLMRRQDQVVRLVYDPQVMEAVRQHARDEGIPPNVAFDKARSYAREIVPGFSRQPISALPSGLRGGWAKGSTMSWCRPRTSASWTMSPRGCHRLRDEPPLEHGLRAGDMVGRAAHRA